MDAAGPGDTILVGDGTYGYDGASQGMAVTISKAGLPGAWITLQAQHPGAAVLDCRETCHSFINLGSGAAYWNIRGFDIRNGYWAGIFSNSGGGHDILIQGNTIHNIGNRPESSAYGIMGIYTDNGAYNFYVDGNVIHDVGRTANQDGRHDHGIYTHGSLSITNNIFYNALNGWHIQTADGFSGTIAGNTFYGSTPQTSTVGQVMLWGADSNLLVRDNIFYAPRTDGIIVFAMTLSGSCSFDHNLVYGPGSPGVAEAAPSACAQTSNLVGVDPLLVNPSGYDFHLRSGSPAIGAGMSAPGLSTDFSGNRRPSPGWDLGAYQYGSGGTTTPVTVQPGSPSTPPATVQPGSPSTPPVTVQPGTPTTPPTPVTVVPGAPASVPDTKAPQKFLTPNGDGINDKAVFGPRAMEVTILDTLGRVIYHASRSGSSLVWNARDSAGATVGSGVYIAKIVRDDDEVEYQSFAVAK